MIIKFIKSHSVYSKGQIAGFPDTAANLLINQGIAVKHVEPVAPKAEPMANKMVKK